MKNGVSRRHFLGSAAAFSFIGTTVAAAPPKASKRPVMRGEDIRKRYVKDVDAIVSGSGLTGVLAFAVLRSSNGEVLEERNAQVGTPPASTAKAITALYAMDALGKDHRFETRLIATGGIVDGEIEGDLILAGGGDPTLDTRDLAALASDLKDAGIIGVKGDFKVYAGHFPMLQRIDPEQPDQVGYNPAVAGIALNYNRVHFEWERGSDGYDVSMEGRAGRYQPEVAMARMEVRDRRGPIYTYEDRDEWTVARAALGKRGARWLPVRKPGLYAGDVFATLAGSEGIRLKAPQVVEELPEGETVATHRSPALLDILQGMLRYSNNLTAEMVGLAATRARIGQVPDLQASAAAMNRWAIAELDMIAPKLVDHSGLGDNSQMTARDMAVGLLKARGSGLEPILKSFTMRDQRGRPVQDHAISVDAKTGTLNFVSGLAGYATTPEGEELTFAIFAADPEERAGISRAERERPPGARAWNRRAKRVQQALIERWAVLYEE
jgi:D-alanyl-D-alanine carboxypeptidase/D-alanyl-D-alanine-endopeptidase (penicillin-binding protein 4)